MGWLGDYADIRYGELGDVDMTPAKMSESMVERVSSVLCDEIYVDAHGCQHGFKEAARAVLLAMREPTEEMRNAALNVGTQAMEGPIYEVAWIAMIDAALSETPLK